MRAQYGAHVVQAGRWRGQIFHGRFERTTLDVKAQYMHGQQVIIRRQPEWQQQPVLCKAQCALCIQQAKFFQSLGAKQLAHFFVSGCPLFKIVHAKFLLRYEGNALLAAEPE